jgi:Domain of unknown function (DUF4926)
MYLPCWKWHSWQRGLWASTLTDEGLRRGRTAYLRQLALDSLNCYSRGFGELERVNRDLKSIIRSLEEVADPSWTSSLLRRWLDLEIIYALALDERRYRLTQEQEVDVRGIVAELVAEFQNYELPPASKGKPEEYDTVILLRAVPEHDLAAGSRGTVVIDYTQYSGVDLAPAYEVEFADSDGITQALVTLSEDDIEVAPASDSNER